MQSIRKFTTLFFLFCTPILLSQNTEPKGLRLVFNEIETKYNCIFSFDDEAVKYAIINYDVQDNLDDALNELSKKTLFNFIETNERTIIVQKKNTVRQNCIQLVNSDTNINIKNLQVLSPYQYLKIDERNKVIFESLPRDQIIPLQILGFKTISIPVSDTEEDCLQTYLQEKIEYLEEVNVTNYLARGITKRNDGALTINYEDFDLLPGLIEPDVLRTLQALPGIHSINEKISYINIRGGTNDQNLVLLDEIKMYQTGHFFGLISAFNPFLTKRALVYKNGTSAIYGDGVSGTVFLNSDREVNKDFIASLGANLISADGFVDAPINEKASIQVSGRRSYNDILNTPTYSSYFDKIFQNTNPQDFSEDDLDTRDKFSFFDTSLRFLYQPSKKDFLRLNFIVFSNKLEYQQTGITPQNEAIGREVDFDQENYSGGLFYRRDFSNKISTYVQAYGTSYKLHSNYFDISNNQMLDQTNEVLEGSFKTGGDFQLLNNLILYGGYQFNQTQIKNFQEINNPYFFRNETNTITTQSLYSEIDYRPRFLPLNIDAGVRFNYIGNFNISIFEPRLSINYFPIKNLSFEVLGEYKSQTTSQAISFQNSYLNIENRRWVLSNPENNIPVMTSRQLSGGITYKNSGFTLNVEPYIKEVKGITSQSQGFQNQFQDVQAIGDYTTYGMDFLGSYTYENITTWLSYSHAKNDYYFPELNPNEFANNIDVRHFITYGINAKVKDFRFAAGANWRTGKPFTPPAEDTDLADGKINYAFPNSSRLRDYFRIDISGTYGFRLNAKTRGIVGFSVFNLLDRENTINKYYRINSQTMEVEPVEEKSLALTPNFTFRIFF